MSLANQGKKSLFLKKNIKEKCGLFFRNGPLKAWLSPNG
jgi:hypothetical protein